MLDRVLLLSGPICAGKSELASLLVSERGMLRLSTRELIEHQIGEQADRGRLQRQGNRLDRETNGRWIATALAARTIDMGGGWAVVDSVRTAEQVSAIREAFTRRVVHVHITAPMEVLVGRFESRARDGDPSSYEEARDAVEKRVDQLASIADVVIDSAMSTSRDVFVRTVAALRLTAEPRRPLVDVMVGAQYGSEGKGHIATHLAGDYGLLVRVGGPNAGHTVMLDDEKYTHRMLPSGSRVNPRAQLLIGPGAVLLEDLLLKEIAESNVDASRLAIDPAALLIQAEDIAFEEDLEKTIGSTRKGVGAATARRVLRGLGFDGKSGKRVLRAEDSENLRPYLRPARQVLDEHYRRGNLVFLEGTQGSALSLYHGPYPHVTSRDTNVAGCLAEAGIAPSRVRRVLMVCRRYPIRVANPDGGGSSGEMHEIQWETVAERSGIPAEELTQAEHSSVTRRLRRVGEFEWDRFRFAVELNAPTDIVLTFADYFTLENRDAHRFEDLSGETIRFIEELERVAQAPVSLVSTGFNHHSIIDRRSW